MRALLCLSLLICVAHANKIVKAVSRMHEKQLKRFSVEGVSAQKCPESFRWGFDNEKHVTIVKIRDGKATFERLGHEMQCSISQGKRNTAVQASFSTKKAFLETWQGMKNNPTAKAWLEQNCAPFGPCKIEEDAPKIGDVKSNCGKHVIGTILPSNWWDKLYACFDHLEKRLVENVKERGSKKKVQKATKVKASFYEIQPSICKRPEPDCDEDFEKMRAEACVNMDEFDNFDGRGFIVKRNVIDPDELAVMNERLAELPDSIRYMCSAVVRNHPECYGPMRDLADYPKTMANIDAMFQEWIANGWADKAGLGRPLTVRPDTGRLGGTNGWPYASNRSCVMSALVTRTMEARDNADCWKRCPGGAKNSYSFCWSRCMITSLVEGTTHEELNERVENLTTLNSEPDCAGHVYDLFQPTNGRPGWDWGYGPSEVAGSDDELLYNFSKTAWGQWEGFGRHRADVYGFVVLRQYLTNITGKPFNTGIYTWHRDSEYTQTNWGGPGVAHRLMLMINKTTEPEKRIHSNLMVVPNNVLTHLTQCGGLDAYASMVDKVWKKDADELPSYHNQTLKHSPDDIYMRLMGIGWSENVLEKMGCRPVLDPGDVLFWREDTFHRTQDSLVDRSTVLLHIDQDLHTCNRGGAETE